MGRSCRGQEVVGRGSYPLSRSGPGCGPVPSHGVPLPRNGCSLLPVVRSVHPTNVLGPCRRFLSEFPRSLPSRHFGDKRGGRPPRRARLYEEEAIDVKATPRGGRGPAPMHQNGGEAPAHLPCSKSFRLLAVANFRQDLNCQLPGKRLLGGSVNIRHSPGPGRSG